jgi:hypothetical protein
MTRLFKVNQLDNIFVFDQSQSVQFLMNAVQFFLCQILQTDLFDRIDFTLTEGFVHSRVGSFADGFQ